MVYKKLVDDIRNEYEEYLYARLPLDRQTIMPHMPMVPDTRVTPTMLSNKNVFLIGRHFSCLHVKKFAEAAEHELVTEKNEGTILACTRNPLNKDAMTLMYMSENKSQFSHKINFPWKNGFRRKIIIKLVDTR